MKNTIVILGLVIIAAAGVYLFLNRDATQLMLDNSEGVSEAVLASTQVFIERRAILESLTLDTTLLDDSRFLSLRSFSRPVSERPVGRDNPFAPAVTP